MKYSVYIGVSRAGDVIVVRDPCGIEPYVEAVPSTGPTQCFKGTGHAETWLRERILDPIRADAIRLQYGIEKPVEVKE